MVKTRNAYRILTEKPLGKWSLGRLRRSWEDNIKMNLKETGCEYRTCMGLAQDSIKWKVLVSVVSKLLGSATRVLVPSLPVLLDFLAGMF
jgi:hypothetical protein